MHISGRDLLHFITESNWIENITREPTADEIEAHNRLLNKAYLRVPDLQEFVWAVARAPLRGKPHLNVQVGQHVAPRGGPEIVKRLELLLDKADDLMVHPYLFHQEYETLHPFMDGNGRSGRAVWLWMMLLRNQYVPDYLFLRHWYYQTLENFRK